MKKNFLYYLSPSIIIGALSAFVWVPITTYYLEPRDFGIYAIINAIMMPIGPLASTGVSWVLAGNYYRINEDERKILVFNILFLDFVLKLLWVIVFWHLSPILLPIIIKDFEPVYGLYFKMSLIGTLLSTFWPSVSYLIILQQKGRVHAAIEVFQWAVGALTTIFCLIFLGLKTLSLFLSPLLAGLVSISVCIWYVKKYVKLEIKKNWLHEIFKVGIPSIPANLMEMITNISDRYFIQKWINLSQLGIYSHSQSYKNIFTMGTKAFSRSFVPPLLEILSKNMDTKTIELQLKKWYGLLGIAGIFTIFFSYEIVNLLTHGKFVGAAPLIPIWFLLILSFTYGMPSTQFLFVKKENKFMMYSGVIIGFVFIGITAFSVYKFGIMGAALSIVLSNFVIQVVRRFYAQKLGYNKIGEKYFSSILALFAGVYAINAFVVLGPFLKAIILLMISICLLKQFDLLASMEWLKKTFVTKLEGRA